MDVRVRPPACRQEPDAGEPDGGPPQPEHGEEPVRLSGDQAPDVGEGQLPDRAGDHDQVGGRRDRRLAAVREAPRPHPLTRRTS